MMMKQWICIALICIALLLYGVVSSSSTSELEVSPGRNAFFRCDPLNSGSYIEEVLWWVNEELLQPQANRLEICRVQVVQSLNSGIATLIFYNTSEACNGTTIRCRATFEGGSFDSVTSVILCEGLPSSSGLVARIENATFSASWQSPITYADDILYTVEVWDSMGQLIWSENTSTTNYSVPLSADLARCTVCACSIGVTTSTKVGVGPAVITPIIWAVNGHLAYYAVATVPGFYQLELEVIPPVCTASARIMGVRTEEKVTPEDFSVTPTADSSVIHFLVPDSYHGHYNVALTANNTAGTNIYWFSVALTLNGSMAEAHNATGGVLATITTEGRKDADNTIPVKVTLGIVFPVAFIAMVITAGICCYSHRHKKRDLKLKNDAELSSTTPKPEPDRSNGSEAYGGIRSRGNIPTTSTTRAEAVAINPEQLTPDSQVQLFLESKSGKNTTFEDCPIEVVVDGDESHLSALEASGHSMSPPCHMMSTPLHHAFQCGDPTECDSELPLFNIDQSQDEHVAPHYSKQESQEDHLGTHVYVGINSREPSH